MQAASDRLLANNAGIFTQERGDLRAAHELASMRTNACRATYYDGCRDLLRDYARYLDPQPDPIYPLTERNLATQRPSSGGMQFEARIELQSHRDDEGRPLQTSGTYYPSAAPFIQETSGMYQRSIELAAAENDLQELRQDHADYKAFYFTMFPNANINAFEARNDEAQVFVDREQDAIQAVDDARMAYETARQTVRDDIATRSPPSELSFAAQTSDYVDTGSADINQRRWAQRAPTTPVRLWQGPIARDHTSSDVVAVPSRPASVATASSVGFSEQLSNGNGSDHSETGRTRARREIWLERRRPLGFEMDRYGHA